MKTIVSTFALLLLLAGSANAQQLKHRPRYLLHIGDTLVLQYRYTPELNQTITILPDGYANINLIGDVKLLDLSVSDAHDLIVEKAKAHLNDPELNVVLKSYQQPYVVVAGEVGKPGRIEIKENTTAVQAVMLSGGFLASAHSNQVLVFRKINGDTAEIRVLKLGTLKKTSDLEHDMQLESGDMLFVPRNKLEKISRFIKVANLGTYFNPLQFVQ